MYQHVSRAACTSVDYFTFVDNALQQHSDVISFRCLPLSFDISLNPQLDEGECFGKMVMDMGDKAVEFRAKGYLAIGLVYSLKATDGE